jgi:hypothetical protein
MVMAVLVGFTALVAIFYAMSLHAVVGNSDGATAVLEGQSMSTGNVLLHQWSLSFDSFWSVDALFYALTVLVTGVQPLLLHLVPALIAALVVVTGSHLARIGYRGISAVAAATTVLALLALPGHVLAVLFLQGPLHVGTVLWCLLAFAGLRHGRLGWGWAMAVVLLAAGTLGDFQMVALGMIPALAGGVVAMRRSRDWHRGISTAAAPVAALVITVAVRTTSNVLGTFSLARANPTTSPSRLAGNLGLMGTWGSHMLGVGGGDLGTGGVPGPLGALHALAIVAVVAGVVVAAVSLVRGLTVQRPVTADPTENWRIDDLLVLAFVADLVVFVVFTTSNDQTFSRYLTAAVVFGSILAGRVVGRWAETLETSRVRRACAVVGVAVLAAFVGGAASNLATATPTRPYQRLGAFLEAHHLDNGIGDYWSASVTTVQTRGAVTIRPVITGPSGRIVRYLRQSTTAWYEGKTFQFLVYDTGHLWGDVDTTSASATFGTGFHAYFVGTYHVLVWNHPLSVSGART